MTFSIQFCLDSVSSERIEALWPLIGARCVSNNTDPHISLINFESSYPDSLVSELGAFASQVTRLQVAISFIGLAKTYSSIMILPIATKQLLLLHQRACEITEKLGIQPLPYYQVDRWTPHITIADETDFDDFDVALRCVLESYSTQPVGIQSIRLIEYKPCREICRFELIG